MPTTPVATYGARRVVPVEDYHQAQEASVALKPSTTFQAGTVLGQITAQPGVFAPYDNAALDGTEVARLILQYPCRTDASGNIALGDQAAGEWGQTVKTAPAWKSGTFKTADLVGLDAAAVADLGRLVEGALADGKLMVLGA